MCCFWCSLLQKYNSSGGKILDTFVWPFEGFILLSLACVSPEMTVVLLTVGSAGCVSLAVEGFLLIAGFQPLFKLNFGVISSMCILPAALELLGSVSFCSLLTLRAPFH